ncbi:DUF1934 domain-containing protein [Natroniella sp. ANB-PHB2]|uniref:DUF1934 domain-containing protein n=1 Tax=Natroniella sp. ANB-PHB2 TaxID=3384444 RepID=UPI0038D48615
MARQVEIEINSLQDTGQDEIEFSSQLTGKLYYRNGVYYLKYEEVLEGLEGTKTTLKIKEDAVTLIRRGKVGGTQKFISEQKTSFDYQTPYGKLPLEIEVERLKVDTTEQAGEIIIKYSLYEQQRLVSCNQLNITYKE